MKGLTGSSQYLNKYGNRSRCRGIKRRTWKRGRRNKRQIRRGRI